MDYPGRKIQPDYILIGPNKPGIDVEPFSQRKLYWARLSQLPEKKYVKIKCMFVIFSDIESLFTVVSNM